MKEISENVDLSKEVLNVNIDSPVFKPILDNLNEKIIEVVKKVYNEEFESGDISLKLTLTVPIETKRFPVETLPGEHPTVKTYEYKALQFEHDITTTFKKVDKEKGKYWGDKELKEDDGKFIKVPIEDPQVSMFDK